MIKRNSSVYSWVIFTLIVFFAAAVSIRYLDAVIAERVMSFLLSIRTLHKVTENIPDILSYLVIAGSILMWVIYLYRTHRKKTDAKTQFLKLAATALPAVYLLKMLFQFSFGRTSPRLWLINKIPLEFDWFNGIKGSSFPSGHMTVFSAFGIAVLIYFPQYRKFVLIFLIILGFALIITDYHFLSDVIGGTYLGVAATYALWRVFEKIGSKHRADAK